MLLLILNPGRADPVDGTGREDQKRDEEQLPEIASVISERELIARYERALREQRRNLEAVHDDAYRAGYGDAVARLRDDELYRNWWTAHPDRQFGTAYWAPDGRRHLADYLETVGPDGPDVRTKPVDQSGVQPTEEQRARDEDQERDEEKEHG
jgi:hypothetical protein